MEWYKALAIFVSLELILKFKKMRKRKKKNQAFTGLRFF